MNPLLTHRQLRFVFEYLQDLNASAAAVRAGYSEKTRASQASELMRNPAVQALIRSELAGLLAELRCSALELMKERARAAFFRAETMFGSGWEVLPLDEMAPETRAALQVSAVLTKRGPTLRVKQPDRDKALRALERVHERLDRLNEQYWAKLEREGKVPGLAEIEGMDGGGVGTKAEAAAGDILEKDQVLSGSAAAGDLTARDFLEKPQVLSGSAGGADLRAHDYLEKPQVLSGSEGNAGCCAASPSSKLRTGFDRLRTNGVGGGSADFRSGEFSQKHQVLSGSGAGADVLAAIFPDKTMVLSGFMGGPEGRRASGRPGVGDLPRPQASPWLLRGGAAREELACAA